MINDFGFIIPQNCQFGMGALKKLPDFLKAAGSDNVMLISDRGLEAIGVVEADGTVFVNPGPAKDGRMAIVDITDGKVSVELIGPTDH